MTIILLISFLWAFLEGRREAQYFHCKWATPNPIEVRDEHLEFSIQRSLYVIGWSLLSASIFNVWFGVVTFLSISLCFSYFHNGSYYSRRNDLDKDIYKLRWRAESYSTTAKFSFDYNFRSLLFSIGLILSLFFDFILLTF